MASGLFEQEEVFGVHGHLSLLGDLGCMDPIEPSGAVAVDAVDESNVSTEALLLTADTDADTEVGSAQLGIWSSPYDDCNGSVETETEAAAVSSLLQPTRANPDFGRTMPLSATAPSFPPSTEVQTNLETFPLAGDLYPAATGLYEIEIVGLSGGHEQLPVQSPSLPLQSGPVDRVVTPPTSTSAPTPAYLAERVSSPKDVQDSPVALQPTTGRELDCVPFRPSPKKKSRQSLPVFGAVSGSDVSASELQLQLSSERANAGVAYSTPRSPTRSRSTRGGYDGLEGLDEEKRAELANKSHTSRCRAKVNAKLAAVMAVLPPPPPNVPVKHKAQALRYVCSMIEITMARQSALEAELMLSHPAKLSAWLRSNMSGCRSLDSALDPVLRLLMARTGWKCADAWKVDDGKACPALRCSVSVVQPGKSHSDPLHRFVRASAPVRFSPTVGVPGRVFASRQPEWTAIAPPPTFLRESVARDVGLTTCFALPLEVHGKVVAVVAVYDTREREYESEVFDISHTIIGAVNSTLNELVSCSTFECV